jgi:hypothetical protein
LDTFKSFSAEIYHQNDESFVRIALEVFRHQAKYNALYNAYVKALKIDINKVNSLNEIPFLPISFFKFHSIQTGDWLPQAIFESSGTTIKSRSRHLIRDVSFYHDHAKKCFEQFFGKLENYHFLALLPSYMERKNSSLISMIRYFIQQSWSDQSGFFLNEYQDLLQKIRDLKNSDRKTIVWGVSFALLELAENFEIDLSHCYLFETGGMKGRRKEITRQELHEVLMNRFNSKVIFSEYGMTELLSQAYTKGDFSFHAPDSMRVIGRDPSDPFCKGLINESSALNIIDLANWDTISFIETEDLGKVQTDGTFEVSGRLDNSEIRGCNLLI